MRSNFFGKRGWWGLFFVLLLLLPAARARAVPPQVGGELRFRMDRENDDAPVYFCPLERTDIDGDISGMFGRIRMRQVFTNPTKRKIEALYVFPLPENASVDRMVMTVGRRRVIGVVKERQEARAIYETAKAQGKVASLLDQERPNVFTQSVANILPGAKVVIEISMVQTVSFADGVFTWAFPLVVGPRYIPSRVADGAKISAPSVPPTTRSGQSLGLTVRLNTGGLPLTSITSEQHLIHLDQSTAATGNAAISLASASELPNRDFVLHYRVGGATIGDALFLSPQPITTGRDKDRFFSLLVTPPQRVAPSDVVPKEMVFVIDRSGSMGGFPIEKAKSTMRQAILAMNPNDTFNLLSFSGGTGKCFDSPVPNTRDNRATALKYLDDLYGSGGTEMLPAIQEALSGQVGDGRVRVVCFMTDGYIGNEGEIIRAIQQHAQATRVFAFGIGTSVNRFLLDAMARAGRGAVEYVTPDSNSEIAVTRFSKRIHSPVLTDVSLDFHGLPVHDVFPKQLPDLFDAAPVIVYGRIAGNTVPRDATITLRGHTAAGAFSRDVRFDTPQVGSGGSTAVPGSDALVSLWARAKVDDYLSRDPMALQGGQTSDLNIKKAVADLGVRYSILTPFTSFVAVEDTSYTGDEVPETVNVPVENPAETQSGNGDGPVFLTQRLYGVSGSMAAKRAASTNTPPQTFAAQPGDPLIRITDAPADTRLIAAVLPDGTTVPLIKNATANTWEAHFDIPLGTVEGVYDVRIFLVRTSGKRQTLTLHYRVDTSGAMALGAVHRQDGGTSYRLEIETDEEAARVTALLPSGERVEMSRSSQAGTHYVATVPGDALASSAVVTFIITDRAHNRTTITVDGTR